ncbi:uncharacterized protein MELLADRAFT_68572 [Melampsora larici-populina 98AG31]|uniref:Uncharacterized protein n=1 Tax=Melampsora larici-populina (strain 98AG31 / pathotype 3-4-7) TaxID=747676 RepID=F4S7A0_MELLP|nr:uncharacterized protein MELLADRAFT_68572 [Melampsora larici-populina 98AG31]EGF99512.1 hypothetical protein MELLADRAFT_68572 [Melampsora larici-populina 98AG31]
MNMYASFNFWGQFNHQASQGHGNGLQLASPGGLIQGFNNHFGIMDTTENSKSKYKHNLEQPSKPLRKDGCSLLPSQQAGGSWSNHGAWDYNLHHGGLILLPIAKVFGENNHHLALAKAQLQPLMEIVWVNGKIDTLTDQLATITRVVIALASASEIAPAKAQAHTVANPVNSSATPVEPTPRKEWASSKKL